MYKTLHKYLLSFFRLLLNGAGIFMLQVDTEELLERFLELFRVHHDSGFALIKLFRDLQVAS